MARRRKAAPGREVQAPDARGEIPDAARRGRRNTMFMRKSFNRAFLMAPDGNGGGGGTPPAAGNDPPANPPANGDNGDGTPPQTPQTWDAWLEAQSDDVKALYNKHTEGLLNTVKATRQERDTLAKQLRDATAKLEEGSEARKQLEALTAQVEDANRRADFYEAATSREVGCRNPKLAWLAAQEAGVIDDKGRVDWEALKASYPELFGTVQQTPAGPPRVPPTNPANPPRLTMDAIKRMTESEINERWDEVQEVLSKAQ